MASCHPGSLCEKSENAMRDDMRWLRAGLLLVRCSTDSAGPFRSPPDTPRSLRPRCDPGPSLRWDRTPRRLCTTIHHFDAPSVPRWPQDNRPALRTAHNKLPPSRLSPRATRGARRLRRLRSQGPDGRPVGMFFQTRLRRNGTGNVSQEPSRTHFARSPSPQYGLRRLAFGLPARCFRVRVAPIDHRALGTCGELELGGQA